MPDATETQRIINVEFNSAMTNAAISAKMMAQAQEEAAIAIGRTLLPSIAEMNKKRGELARKVADAATANPGLAKAGMGTAFFGGNFLNMTGQGTNTVLPYLVAAALVKNIIPSWLKNAGSAAGGALGNFAKGAASLPGTAAGSALSRMFPNGVPMATQNAIAAATRSITRGAILGVITGVGQYGMDKGFDWATAGRKYPAGYDPKAMLNRGVWGHGKSLLESLGLIAPAPSPAAPGMPVPAGWQARAGAAGTSITDPAAYEAAKARAAEAGSAIQASLAVTAKPSLDLSDLAKALELANQLGAKLAALGPAMQRTAATMRGTTRSTAALHDGYETQ